MRQFTVGSAILALPLLAHAQGQAGALEGLVGILLLYLVMVGVALVGITLFANITRQCMQGITRAHRSTVLRGALVSLIVGLVVALLGLASRNLQDKNFVNLLTALLLLGFSLIVLLGFGAVVWHLGTVVLSAFGKSGVAPGWAVMMGVAVLLSVVWIPLFGWALGLYWLFQAVGGAITPLFGEPKPLPPTSE